MGPDHEFSGYEYFTAPYERNDRNANFVVGPNKLIYINNNIPPSMPAAFAVNIPPGIDNRGLVKTYKNSFASKMGLAYQLAPNTVFRAGGVVFFGDPGAAGLSSRTEYNPPFRVGYAYTSDNIHPTLTLATRFPANALDPTVLDPSTNSLNAWDPNSASSVVYHGNATLEQQLGKFLVDANYVGTKGSHPSTFYNINAPDPGWSSTAARCPLPRFQRHYLC